MLVWILVVLLVNGIISFAYSAFTSSDPAAVWGLLATNFLFYLGLSQTGIIFSAIMRIAKSEWGKYFSRLGEVLTLSCIPVSVVTFLIIYFGGTDHLFYWAAPQAEGAHAHHLSPWLGKGLFFWRNVFFMSVFYLLSYWYFRTACAEADAVPVNYDGERRLNVLASLVMGAYVVANTNLAWDFGMMIIPHWESTIFPAYYWVGNVFAGPAFLFLISFVFLSKPGKPMSLVYLDSIGKLLISFALLWIYMFWSQYMVIWYGDMPELTKPLFQRMEGNYAFPFMLMIVALFFFPFFMLLFRKVKLSASALAVVSFVICAGVWINRYLMVIPVFSDGTRPVFATWTGFSLIFTGIAALLLSVKVFLKFYPVLEQTAHVHHGHGEDHGSDGHH